MKELYIRQEIFTLGEKLTVKDDQQKNIYYIRGVFQIPKTFSIMDENRNEVALITRKYLVFALSFKYVEVQGKQILTINRKLSFSRLDILLMQRA